MYLGFYTFGIGHFSSLLYNLLLLLRIQYSSVFKSNYRITKLTESVTNFGYFMLANLLKGMDGIKKLTKIMQILPPKNRNFHNSKTFDNQMLKVGNTDFQLKDLANHNHL